MSYQYVRGSDFYADAVARIAASPQVTVQMATWVDQLEAVPGGVRLTTRSGAVTAHWVVDTRPVRQPAMLYQCFAGVELESESPVSFTLALRAGHCAQPPDMHSSESNGGRTAARKRD
ncbi:hypothetical protein [Rhodoglobus vestalii]|uniref:hypothetical protein n=1 Tax=Rhodoglobus vestalii TaxID=193384 RepID=UPI0011508320|nr:hypothetical protein [Rhodoglobus vestalii]